MRRWPRGPRHAQDAAAQIEWRRRAGYGRLGDGAKEGMGGRASRKEEGGASLRRVCLDRVLCGGDANVCRCPLRPLVLGRSAWRNGCWWREHSSACTFCSFTVVMSGCVLSVCSISARLCVRLRVWSMKAREAGRFTLSGTLSSLGQPNPQPNPHEGCILSYISLDTPLVTWLLYHPPSQPLTAFLKPRAEDGVVTRE